MVALFYQKIIDNTVFRFWLIFKKQLKGSNPIIIARETLRQLASLRIPPTPDNYHKLYDQISGNSENDPNPSVKASINQHTLADNPATEPSAWGNTIEALLKQLDNKQGTLTITKKREGVNRVFVKYSKDSNQLHSKLKALVDSWGALAAATHELTWSSKSGHPS